LKDFSNNLDTRFDRILLVRYSIKENKNYKEKEEKRKEKTRQEGRKRRKEVVFFTSVYPSIQHHINIRNRKHGGCDGASRGRNGWKHGLGRGDY